MDKKVCIQCNCMRDGAFLCDGKCEWKHPFWTGYDGRVDGQEVMVGATHGSMAGIQPTRPWTNEVPDIPGAVHVYPGDHRWRSLPTRWWLGSVVAAETVEDA